jgi:hypothetical protein
MKTGQGVVSPIYETTAGSLTDDAPATPLRDHLYTCVLVAKEGASKVDTNDAVEIFHSSLQGKVSPMQSAVGCKQTLDKPSLLT